jgi:hypothetical protein
MIDWIDGDVDFEHKCRQQAKVDCESCKVEREIFIELSVGDGFAWMTPEIYGISA